MMKMEDKFEKFENGKMVKTAAIDMMERYREVEKIERGKESAEVRFLCE